MHHYTKQCNELLYQMFQNPCMPFVDQLLQVHVAGQGSRINGLALRRSVVPIPFLSSLIDVTMSLLSVPLERLSQGQITQIQALFKAHHDCGQTALQRGDYAAMSIYSHDPKPHPIVPSAQ